MNQVNLAVRTVSASIVEGGSSSSTLLKRPYVHIIITHTLLLKKTLVAGTLVSGLVGVEMDGQHGCKPDIGTEIGSSVG